MTTMNTQTDKYQDSRDAVRALCAEFPDEYHRKVDEKRAYPEAFVDALTKAGWLAALSPQQGRIVELRYFGGLSLEETAEVLGVSSMTVKRGWALARAWLHKELSQ